MHAFGVIVAAVQSGDYQALHWGRTRVVGSTATLDYRATLWSAASEMGPSNVTKNASIHQE